MRDFESIRDKVMGSIENRVRSAYNKGYDAGYEDGTKEKPSLIYEQYKQGLNDGWKCVKMFHLLSNEKLEQMFGCSVVDIFNKSASEVIAVFKKYEKDKEFKVGDEVICYDQLKKEKGVVLAVEITGILVLKSGGNFGYFSKEEIMKSGRHFEQITDVVKQMKEGDT